MYMDQKYMAKSIWTPIHHTQVSLLDYFKTIGINIELDPIAVITASIILGGLFATFWSVSVGICAHSV